MQYLFYFLGSCYLIDQLGYGSSRWIPILVLLAACADLFLFAAAAYSKAKNSKES